MRLFFAIPIPDEHKTKLFAAFPSGNYHGIRFTVPEQLHITMHFLGETDKEKLQEIILHTNEFVPNCKPFEIKYHSFKTIRRQGKPVIIWAQMEQSEAFETLSMQFRGVFPTGENKKPNPHVTIARIKQLKQLPFELPHLKPFSFKADTVELLESTTHPTGAIYRLIERWKLK